MKTKELRQKSKQDLKDLLKKAKADYVEFRFNVSEGNTKDIKDMVESRKTIARITTILNEQV